MVGVRFFEQKQKLKVLCLGAHADDIEIGCGGTVLRITEETKNAEICWTVFSGDDKRLNEAKKSAELFLENAHSKEIVVHKFRESYFPFIGDRIKDCLEKLKHGFSPDIIFTHYGHDAHQDHEMISRLTWSTFRDHFIMEYEIPKYDGDLSTPNLYVHLNESLVKKKIGLVLGNFLTQKEKPWFTEDTFRSILRLRGIESNSPSKYSEAFHCRKIVLRE